jgi:hypothetical protein
MKNTIVLGLCLVTTVSVFSVKNTKSNEIGLGDAKIVMANNDLNANKRVSNLPTITLIDVASLKVPQRVIDYMLEVYVLEGSVENILSNIEVQDEIDSKMKTL